VRVVSPKRTGTALREELSAVVKRVESDLIDEAGDMTVNPPSHRLSGGRRFTLSTLTI
jgi:hypothetical protein